MNYPENVVSIHPYFQVQDGQLATFKSLMPQFIEKTRTEKANLFYEFTINGNEVFCREAYVGAEGVLAHLANVAPVLDEVFKIATLTRLEMHGPAAELDQLREPMAAMNPIWYTLEIGLRR